jgi:saccharopine dehydrogenase (NADP+, L-glutamate forming)
MLEYGIPNGATAMARTVGIPCAIAVQLILDGGHLARASWVGPSLSGCVCGRACGPGRITERGVLAPLTPALYNPIIEMLELEGLSCKEEVVVV